jgi:RsiW-degrading membrane proteinase PrsW (M82 family)
MLFELILFVVSTAIAVCGYFYYRKNLKGKETIPASTGRRFGGFLLLYILLFNLKIILDLVRELR